MQETTVAALSNGDLPALSVTIFESGISDAAKEALRFQRHPSGRMDRVTTIKMLAGALLTELEDMEFEVDNQPPGEDVPPVYGHINRARDAVIVASMCTVLAATTGK